MQNIFHKLTHLDSFIYHSEVQTLHIFVSYTLSRSTWLSTWKKRKRKNEVTYSHGRFFSGISPHALHTCTVLLFLCLFMLGFFIVGGTTHANTPQACSHWSVHQSMAYQSLSMLRELFFFLQEFSIIHLTFYALNKVYDAHFFFLQVNVLPVR